jgi:hypothetical protein
MHTTRSPRAYPVRQVSRIVTELHLTGVANLRELSPDHYERGILLQALIRNSLPDWFDGNELRAPSELRYYTSINTLAASFRRPFETVRRHVRALVAEGACVEVARGVAVGADPAMAARLTRFLAMTHDTLLRIAEELHELGLLPRCSGPDMAPPRRAITGAGLDLQLLPMESLREPLPDWTVLLVWGVIDGLCVRHVTVDPVLSATFSHDSTPDEVRRPVMLRTVAAASGVPYQSVWRHAKALAATGAITAKGDGYIVSPSYLRSSAMEERVIGVVEYFQRRIVEMIREGLDPAKPMPWLIGRPPLLAA